MRTSALVFVVAAAVACAAPKAAQAVECQYYVEAWGTPAPVQWVAKESARRAWVRLVTETFGLKFSDEIASAGRGTWCRPASGRYGGAWQCVMRAKPCEPRHH
jgi:hypothetical protein